MEMVLPASYVAIEEEEMLYLDGGQLLRSFSGFQGWTVATSLAATGKLLAVTGGFMSKAVLTSAPILAAMGPIGWLGGIIGGFNGIASATIGGVVASAGYTALDLMARKGKFNIYRGRSVFNFISAG